MNPAFLLSKTPENTDWLTFGFGEDIPALAHIELLLTDSGDLDGLQLLLEEKALVIQGVTARKRTEKEGQGITDANAEIREVSLNTLREQISIAARYGKKLFVGDWVGPIGKTLPFKVENRFVNGMRSLAETADRAGVTLLVSPVNRYERDWMLTAENTLAMLNKVGRPNCKMALDFFHANIEEAGVEKVLESRMSLIDHIYLCDNNRGIPGTGSFDFLRILQILEKGNYPGTLTVKCENKTGLSRESAIQELGAAGRFLTETFGKITA